MIAFLDSDQLIVDNSPLSPKYESLGFEWTVDVPAVEWQTDAGGKRFVTYQVVVRCKTAVRTLYRRFSQFEALQKDISKSFKLTLPGKTTFFQNTTPEFLEKRRADLEAALRDLFLRAVSNKDSPLCAASLSELERRMRFFADSP